MEDYNRSKYLNTYSLNDSSDSLSRMQQHYWTTKQAVFRKLGKKEDDCIIASDMELDLKLELFQTIEESFLTLMRVLESYQDKLCALAQEENVLGRFLKENGKQNKTRAGKAMYSAGKALSYSAQQRLTLRIPLVRLYQEVETFQYRAIVDTLQTIEKMEKARTAYRGTLMWMKDVSQQLDPDTCKQLEKFRKVQSQVRKAKQVFDNLKLDTLQKIDLLSFSRCNLFSQALSSYQASLLNVSKKVAFTSNSVAKMTKGYQHYEFSTLKELTETSRKLAEETGDLKSLAGDDKDTIIYFESEYHDEVDSKQPEDLPGTNAHNNSLLSSQVSEVNHNNTKAESVIEKHAHESRNENLLNLEEHDHQMDPLSKSEITFDQQQFEKEIGSLSVNNMEGCSSGNKVNFSTADLDFLQDDNFMSEWKAVFGDESVNSTRTEKIEENEKDKCLKPSFLPSQLLNANFDIRNVENVEECASKELLNHTDALHDEMSKMAPEMSRKGKQDMSAWFNLFADLDPLSNPDLIGKKKDSQDDRNC